MFHYTISNCKSTCDLITPTIILTTGEGLVESHSHMSTPTLQFPIDPTSPPYTTQIHNGVFLDLDSTSSSEDDGFPLRPHDFVGEEWVGAGEGGGGGANDEDSVDNVYMYAWALDGRRIGESGATGTGRTASPTSINDPIIVSVLVM